MFKVHFEKLHDRKKIQLSKFQNLGSYPVFFLPRKHPLATSCLFEDWSDPFSEDCTDIIGKEFCDTRPENPSVLNAIMFILSSEFCSKCYEKNWKLCWSCVNCYWGTFILSRPVIFNKLFRKVDSNVRRLFWGHRQQLVGCFSRLRKNEWKEIQPELECIIYCSWL